MYFYHSYLWWSTWMCIWCVLNEKKMTWNLLITKSSPSMFYLHFLTWYNENFLLESFSLNFHYYVLCFEWGSLNVINFLSQRKQNFCFYSCWPSDDDCCCCLKIAKVAKKLCLSSYIRFPIFHLQVECKKKICLRMKNNNSSFELKVLL